MPTTRQQLGTWCARGLVIGIALCVSGCGEKCTDGNRGFTVCATYVQADGRCISDARCDGDVPKCVCQSVLSGPTYKCVCRIPSN